MTYLVNNDTTIGSSVRIGKKAPDFTLKTNKNADWNLSSQLGKVTVLLFYPQNECIICTKQLCSVRDNWDKYTETGATIVGISPGKISDHANYAEKYHLPITLLVDEKRKISKLFGNHWLFPHAFTRAIVIVDAAGIVRSRKVMFRAFRPSDSELLTDIYNARVDAISQKQFA